MANQTPGPRPVRADRGSQLTCRSWPQEAALRMLMNNLDPEVAERPDDLVVYGGTGRAARSWADFDAIVATLRRLEDDETMLVQSGRPVGVFRTHEWAPRVLIANAMLVPDWANWPEFRRLEAAGLTMYGQMTAGSWIYIGTQGILQGTYETFAAVAERRFGGTLAGTITLSAGLGGMGGAQPLAVTMNGGVALMIDVDPSRIQRRLETRYLDRTADSLDEACRIAVAARDARAPVSIGVVANAAEAIPHLAATDFPADIVTDQTSAHDPLSYIPAALSLTDARDLAAKDPERFTTMARDSMARHVEGMVSYLDRGAEVFDYGNNLRTEARTAGYQRAFDYPGFVPAYIRPLFCEGKGPFRWAALSGDPHDIGVTDQAVISEFPEQESMVRWIRMASDRVAFQGLPARICWLGYGERHRAGLRFNELVAGGQISAPLVIGRDHLDSGSVASPYRETEAMADGSDAIADWPILNALLNTSSGAAWVSVHHGGGVGIGRSIHAGVVAVADGTDLAAQKLERVLTNDPGTGIARHADAGYAEAIDAAHERGVDLPRLPAGITVPSGVSAEATAARFRRWFDALAAVGGAPDLGWNRFAWTEEDAATRRWFDATAAELGLVTERDANGNLWAWWGRLPPSPGHKGVLTGSHLDTVPAGGAFDGALGVVAGFTAIAELQRRGQTPGRPIGVAAFADEEGARFNTATFGSRLLTGALEPVTVLGRTDGDGVSLGQAVADAGLDPDRLGPDPLRVASISSMVELHIEQGLALDRRHALIGLATAIWPHGRWRLGLTGEANHAGTTLLGDRRDPTLVLARAIDAARLAAARVGGVATVGRIVVDPNSTNSVPGRLTAWLDARAPTDAQLDDLLSRWAAGVRASATEHGVDVELTAESRSPAVHFDPDLAARIDRCLRSRTGHTPVALDTAAGHDAGALAAAIPTAMLFVRNPTGVSHSPHERADMDDCLAGALALADVLEELATP